MTKAQEKPPAWIAKDLNPSNYTGYWMGWHWINGVAVGKAPPVSR